MEDYAMKDRPRVSIQSELMNLNKIPGRRQRLGILAPVFGTLLLVLFAVFLLPLFLYMLFFNKVYFWIRNQNSIDLKPYYAFDRHRVPHLGLMDKFWCEYCEWANGTLQWTADIVNEVERRYCPIKNSCSPHCEKAKAWRKSFLDFDHGADELRSYYRERYFAEGPETRTSAQKGHGG